MTTRDVEKSDAAAAETDTSSEDEEKMVESSESKYANIEVKVEHVERDGNNSILGGEDSEKREDEDEDDDDDENAEKDAVLNEDPVRVGRVFTAVNEGGFAVLIGEELEINGV